MVFHGKDTVQKMLRLSGVNRDRMIIGSVLALALFAAEEVACFSKKSSGTITVAMGPGSSEWLV